MLKPPRFSVDLVLKTREEWLSKGDGSHFLILSDLDLPENWENTTIVDVRGSKPLALHNINFVNVYVLYAVDQDDLGVPFIKWLVERRIQFHPIYSFEPGWYINKDLLCRHAIANEFQRQQVERFAKFDSGIGDAENICQALAVTKHLEGVYVEVGCFNGSSGCVALRYMQEAEIYRPSYFFDVFDGFDYEEALKSSDIAWKGTHKSSGQSLVTERLEEFSRPILGRPVHVMKNNIITDIFPQEISQIAVANLDVDMLEAVYHGLLRLAPRIVVGGILIVEDAGHTPALVGAQTALEMFLKTPIAEHFIPLYMRSGQYFLIRISKE